jgi:hypothetical protein
MFRLLNESKLLRLSSVFGLVVGCIAASAILGCATATAEGPNSHGDSSTLETPRIQDEYRLKEDRKILEELRKDIPEETQVENDELALLLKLTSETQEKPPTKVREKFNSLARKKRNIFQKDMTRKRAEYVKAEKKGRDQFTKENERLKKEFKKKKTSREESREFYSEGDERRRSFYQELREKRAEFETDMRDERKNFDDYMREKTSEFNQEARAYEKRYAERKKLKEEEVKMKAKLEKEKEIQRRAQTASPVENRSSMGGPSSFMDEQFKEIDKQPAQHIGTDEE